MFSYYGSKSKLVDYYPPPKYGRIIEPFAGSARYSLKYWQKDIVLIDKFEKIIKLWKWLQICTENDILSLPDLTYKQTVDDYNLTEEQRLLMGFMVAQGVASPQKIVQQFSNIKSEKKRIASNLHKIKHWDIRLGDYYDIENDTATWFIDPPYQFGGEHYRESGKNIDYQKLGEWCRTRNGQIIVCENTKANWMQFLPITKFNGAYTTTTEAIWSNQKTNYDNVQIELF